MPILSHKAMLISSFFYLFIFIFIIFFMFFTCTIFFHYERSPTPTWHGIQQSSPPLSLYGSFLSRPPQKLQPYYPLKQLMRKLPPLIARYNLLYLELLKLLLDFQGHFPLRNGMVCGFFLFFIFIQSPPLPAAY